MNFKTIIRIGVLSSLTAVSLGDDMVIGAVPGNSGSDDDIGYFETNELHQEVQESGKYCNISAEISCTLNEAYPARPCSALKETPHNECSDVDLLWTYNFCNNNEEEFVTLRPMLTIPLFHTEMVTDISNISFDKSKMKPGECRSYSLNRLVSSCDSHNTVASLKVEGFISGKRAVDGYYCYAYDFKQEKIGLPPPQPILVELQPVIDLSIYCDFMSDGSSEYSTDCKRLKNYVPQTIDECEVKVKYSYQVMNESSDQIRLQAIVNEKAENLISQPDTRLLGVRNIAPETLFVASQFGIINVCKRNGKTLKRKSLAVATSIYGSLSGFDQGTLDINMPELLSEFKIKTILCFYRGTTCDDYIIKNDKHCFDNDEVKIQYKVKNIGLGCTTVENAEVQFGPDEPYRALPLDGQTCYEGRISCPGDILTFTEKRFINTCGLGTGTIPVDISINGADPDGDDPDAEGSSTTPTGTVAAGNWEIIGGGELPNPQQGAINSYPPASSPSVNNPTTGGYPPASSPSVNNPATGSNNGYYPSNANNQINHSNPTSAYSEEVMCNPGAAANSSTGEETNVEGSYGASPGGGGNSNYPNMNSSSSSSQTESGSSAVNSPASSPSQVTISSPQSMNNPKQCTTFASELVFEYNSKKCEHSQRKRRTARRGRKLRSGKGSGYAAVTSNIVEINRVCKCQDFTSTTITTTVSIQVTSTTEVINYLENSLGQINGDRITITANQGENVQAFSFQIYDFSGILVQTTTFDFSGECLEDLIGLVFGSFTLVGFR